MNEADVLSRAICEYINTHCEGLTIHFSAEDYWWTYEGLESPDLYSYTQSPLAALLQFIEHQKRIIQQPSKEYQQFVILDMDNQICRYVNDNASELRIDEDEGKYAWMFRGVNSQDTKELFDTPLAALIDFVETEREVINSFYEWHPNNQRKKIIPKKEPKLTIDDSDDEPFHPLWSPTY